MRGAGAPARPPAAPRPAEQLLTTLPAQLQAMRHVRFVVSDAAGVPIGSPARRATDRRNAAPPWFAALVAPSVDSRAVALTAEGRTVGHVDIIGEPGDEIAEVWANAVAMGLLAVLLNGAMIGLLYVLFGRVLDPLSVLADGLSSLERHAYAVRLPQPRTRELSTIARHFNALARALEAVRAENLRLNRRLIRAQDDERRRTARELHDEVGPCLFGLKANASSIASAAENLPMATRQSVTERLHDILSIIAHLQTINRSMLERLRPMALGHVPLRDMLDRLVSERARQHPQISFSLAAHDLADGYGDSIDLTVYRCVQEGLTNAVRHARPQHVSVTIRHRTAERELALALCDDGSGFDPATPPGFGLRGMRERVEGLGGRCRIDSAPGLGTCIAISIALADAADGAAGEASADVSGA